MSDPDLVFLFDEADQLVRVPCTPYASEEMLQHLIVSHPDLLAGEQMNPTEPPRWLLVQREMRNINGTAMCWSASHLLLDQRGVPTFVEVKRTDEANIRREVIGQMIEYAANAARYWPVERIRSLALEQAGGMAQLEEKIRNLLGENAENFEEIELFWKQVDENLHHGPFRLLFVADNLSKEVQRIISFLNEQMPWIEVLGVEVRQYLQGSFRALLPRVLGQHAETIEAANSEPVKQKSAQQAFLEACPAFTRALFQEVLEQAAQAGYKVSWESQGFCIHLSPAVGQDLAVLYGYPAGALGLNAPFLEIPLRKWGDSPEADSLRKTLVGEASFQEVGQHTLRAFLLEDYSLPKVRAGLPAFWEACRSLMAKT